MKRILASLIMFIVVVTMAFNVSQAQTNQSPNNFDLFKAYNIPVNGYPDSTSVKTFVGRIDTLYSRYWINRTSAAYQTPQYFRVGGASRSSITLDVSDTCSIGIVVKARTRSLGFGAAAAWATIATDSIRNIGSSASSGLVKEVSLVDTDSDLFDALDTELMIICTTNADIHGTTGNERRRVRLNWVP